MAKKKSPTDAILLELRAFGLAYPGAHLKSPWPGHMDLAVNDKTFAYLSVEGEPLGVGCKLPKSAAIALLLPGATPMAYGLGKSGWVSLRFEGVAPGAIDVDMLKAWLDESYRAQAPKKLIKKLTPGSATAASPARARSPRTRRAGAPRSAGASDRARARRATARASGASWRSRARAARAARRRAASRSAGRCTSLTESPPNSTVPVSTSYATHAAA